MRIALPVAVAVAACLVACSKTAQQPAAPTTDDDKALYAMGVMLSSNVRPFELTDTEMAMLNAGLADGSKDQSKLKPEELEAAMPKIQELHTARQSASMEREKQSGTEYLAKAAAESGAVKSETGVVYKAVKEGTGASPKDTDTVKVHYEGKFVSGKVFDSSKERGEPISFPLNGVIPCWTEAVQKMKVGGTAQVVCPSDQAYGDRGNPPDMPGGATLIFDVELLEIVDPAAAAAAEGPAAP